MLWRRIKGRISFYRLTRWWRGLRKEEKNILIENFGDSLIKGHSVKVGGSPSFFLISLTEGLNKSWAEYQLVIKILDKAERLAKERKDVLDLHFVYNAQIIAHYRWREKDEALKQLNQSQSLLDKMAKKGIIKPNKAARKTSRLAKLVKTLG